MGPALDKHVALIGFMGAGKTTIGEEVARRLGRPFVDLDREIERDLGLPVVDIFDQLGEPAFRASEVNCTTRVLENERPSVLAVGGGAVEAPEIRTALAERALTVWLDVDVGTAWERARGTRRPLARDERDFRARFARRQPLYRELADALALSGDDVVLAAAAVHVETGALARLGELVPGDGPVALLSDAHVAGIHGADAHVALGDRVASVHELPRGEAAKSLAECERLWRELRLDRGGTIVALGGGSSTDAAGFVAATYLRGVAWCAVPTTLVGQVDAAIGGKTAVDLPEGKNLVGAFHWPARAMIDPALLETLPDHERREGLAEVVKTGLLAGESFWELPTPELVRRCAAYKAAVCVRDPFDRGERAVLNLGHTFAHALEAASDYRVTHGQAVGLGLLAALRLSGASTADVEEVLRPEPVRIDRERAWAALQRDKKGADGRLKLVLLRHAGAPEYGVELPESDVRRALDALIA